MSTEDKVHGTMDLTGLRTRFEIESFLKKSQKCRNRLSPARLLMHLNLKTGQISLSNIQWDRFRIFSNHLVSYLTYDNLPRENRTRVAAKVGHSEVRSLSRSLNLVIYTLNYLVFNIVYIWNLQKWYTLVCLNLGMASVAKFLKFPIFRKIDVFWDPKIPNFLENWCFSDKKLWFLEFFDKKWWFLGQFYKLYNSLQTWPFQYQSWILAGQTFWFLKIWLIYEPWTIEIWFYGP